MCLKFFIFLINFVLTVKWCNPCQIMFIITIWQFGEWSEWIIRLATYFTFIPIKTQYNYLLVDYCTCTFVEIKIKWSFPFKSISINHWHLSLVISTTENIIVIFPLKWTWFINFSFLTKFKIKLLITIARFDRISTLITIISVNCKNI